MNENGQPILRVGTMGRRLMAIGDENDARKLKPSEVDVVQAQNAWHLIDSQYRGPEGKIPNEKLIEYSLHAVQFVCEVMGYQPVGPDGAKKWPISGAEAIAFMALVEREVAALRPFFEVKSPDEPSLRGSFTPRFSE